MNGLQYTHLIGVYMKLPIYRSGHYELKLKWNFFSPENYNILHLKKNMTFDCASFICFYIQVLT